MHRITFHAFTINQTQGTNIQVDSKSQLAWEGGSLSVQPPLGLGVSGRGSLAELKSVTLYMPKNADILAYGDVPFVEVADKGRATLIDCCLDQAAAAQRFGDAMEAEHSEQHLAEMELLAVVAQGRGQAELVSITSGQQHDWRALSRLPHGKIA